ncbi:hypothetical protein GF402_00005, partial [Candidatus Fermentibacteria bacterium]|nr:hypothetical protein [Candidatus Fermentibacteria bacterium]
MRFLTLSPILLIVSICLAGTATQTDWSGGDGVWGPVTSWGDEFYVDTDVNWSDSPGNLNLQIKVVEHLVFENWEEPRSLYAEDINGDGYIDIVSASYAFDEDVRWWKNENGSGTSWTHHVVDLSFRGGHGIQAEDINDDGYMDIVGAARDDNDITWWENDDGSGTSWTTHLIEGYFERAFAVHAEDINGDGNMDVVGAAYDVDEITWWENDDGSGTSWTKHLIDGNIDGSPSSVYGEDLDGDGDIDVL